MQLWWFIGGNAGCSAAQDQLRVVQQIQSRALHEAFAAILGDGVVCKTVRKIVASWISEFRGIARLVRIRRHPKLNQKHPKALSPEP